MYGTKSDDSEYVQYTKFGDPEDVQYTKFGDLENVEYTKFDDPEDVQCTKFDDPNLGCSLNYGKNIYTLRQINKSISYTESSMKYSTPLPG